MDEGEEGAVGGEGFFATTQDDGVAGFDGEGADIYGDIGTGFVDDGHDAEGDGDAFGVDAAGEGFFFELVADGIGHCEEGLQVSGDGVQAWLGEQEAIEKGIAKPGCFGVGVIAGVGGEYVAGLIPQALGKVGEEVVFLLGGDLGELTGGLACGFCNLGQVGHLGTSLKEEQVVVVYDFVAVIIAEGVFDLLGLESDDFGEVFVAVVDEAEGEFFVVFIFEADDIATCECPTSVLDADGEQAAAIPQRKDCTGVELEPAAIMTGFGEHVAFAGFELGDEGGEAGANGFAGDDIPDALGVFAIGDDDFAAGAAGEVSGLEFGEHAARADAVGGTTGYLPDFGGDFGGGNLTDDLGIGVAAWVGGVEAVLVGEEHEQVGFDEVGDECREVVIVTQADFFGADGVVFVDDGNDAVLDEGFEGVTGVEVAATIGEVFAGEQDLADGNLVVAEELAVDFHEARLANGGEHLFGGDVARECGVADGLAADGDGARADDDELVALLVQGGDDAHEFDHVRDGELGLALGEGGGAEFEDDSFGVHGGIILGYRQKGEGKSS